MNFCQKIHENAPSELLIKVSLIIEIRKDIFWTGALEIKPRSDYEVYIWDDIEGCHRIKAINSEKALIRMIFTWGSNTPMNCTYVYLRSKSCGNPKMTNRLFDSFNASPYDQTGRWTWVESFIFIITRFGTVIDLYGCYNFNRTLILKMNTFDIITHHKTWSKWLIIKNIGSWCIFL